MTPRPLVGLTFTFALGIILAANLNFNLELWVFFLGAGILIIIALAGYFLAWRDNRRVIFLLFLILGFIYTRLSLTEINPDFLAYAGHWVTIRGVVSQEADVRADRIYYYLDARQITLGPQKTEHKRQGVGKGSGTGAGIWLRGFAYGPRGSYSTRRAGQPRPV
ncbi:hypothetical protein HX99_01135 [Peptococcaceae bacterium SCADC1_2_3]|nr:hypothetical protein HX99_01135 [Peptococcaceae bacterium SCADC1_2_3]